MNNKELNIKNYELVAIKRKDGVFTTETGQNIEFKNYYVEFKNKNNPLIIRAKVDKVFRDYVEDATDAEYIGVPYASEEAYED